MSGAADGHTVSVTRYPAAAAARRPGDHAAPEGPYAFRHLSCEIRDGRSAAAERASVLTLRTAARGTHAAAREARRLLDDFPGSLAAGVPTTGGTHVVAVRAAPAMADTAAEDTPATGAMSATSPATDAAASDAPFTHAPAADTVAAVEIAVTGPPVDTAVAAALAYARLRSGVALPGTADLSFAGRTEDVLLTPLPGTGASTPP